jgi:transcriptional regulator with XRE-family HTH domain
MLSTLLQQEMKARGLSSHGVAAEIGTSHTTVLRALKGERIDVDTLIKLANWLHVPPSELLNSMVDGAEFSTATQLSAILARSPELEAELKDALERVKADQLDPSVIRDIISFAAYKITTSGEYSNVAARSEGARDRTKK